MTFFLFSTYPCNSSASQGLGLLPVLPSILSPLGHPHLFFLGGLYLILLDKIKWLLLNMEYIEYTDKLLMFRKCQR